MLLTRISLPYRISHYGAEQSISEQNCILHRTSPRRHRQCLRRFQSRHSTDHGAAVYRTIKCLYFPIAWYS